MNTNWWESGIFYALINLIGPVILKIVFQWIKNCSGDYIIVERVLQSSQITISNKVKGDLSIKYKNKEVTELVLNDLMIKNIGNKTIKGGKFIINVLSRPSIKDELFFEIIPQNIDNLNLKFTVSENKEDIEVDFDHLNSIKKQKESKYQLAILSNFQLGFSVKGDGNDWGVKFKDSYLMAIRRETIILALIPVIFISVTLITNIFLFPILTGLGKVFISLFLVLINGIALIGYVTFGKIRGLFK